MRTDAIRTAGRRQGLPLGFAGSLVHFIGVGGSGMSGAAALMLQLGADVSGSDLVPFDGMGELVSRGARVAIGHRKEQLDASTNLVVISAAIPETNPELTAARALDVPVVKYAELLAALMRAPRKGMAIAGTHGKTTTTAMCAYLCREGGLSPSFLAGAPSSQLGGSSGIGTGPLLVVEACEFDRSFLNFAPESAAILNIEPDHLDCYRDLDEIVEAFAMFARNVDPDGLLICNAEDHCASIAADAAKAPVQTFGFEDGADWRAAGLRRERGCYTFDIRLDGQALLSTRLSIPGRHNVANALAAVALAVHAGVDLSCIGRTLPTFAGVSRRLSWRGEGRGVTIIDDYAHHPTEIRATIKAARDRYRPKRTWAIFQPHQYARTRHFMAEFADSFGEADEIIVPDIYAAREMNGAADAPGDARAADGVMGSKELVSRICQGGGRARYFPGLDDVADHLLQNVMEGDLVLTMGAGDIWKVADELVERICEPHRA